MALQTLLLDVLFPSGSLRSKVLLVRKIGLSRRGTQAIRKDVIAFSLDICCRRPACSSAGLHVTLLTLPNLFLPASSDLDIPSSAMLARYRLFSLLLFPGVLKPKSNYSVGTNISLPSATSPPFTTIPRLNTSEPECWNPPQSRGYVFEVKPEECEAATLGIIGARDPFKAVTFSNAKDEGFRLPRTFKYHTCDIFLFVALGNSDMLLPKTLYNLVLDLAYISVRSAHHNGEKRTVGPRYFG